MSAPQLVIAALVRTAVYAVLFVAVAVDAGFRRTDASTDALALGLLLIAVALVVTVVWSLVDGVRRGFVAALVLWVVSSLLIGLAIGILASRDVVVDEGTTDLLAGWLGGVLATFPFAVVGVALGGIVHRVRGSGSEPARTA